MPPRSARRAARRLVPAMVASLLAVAPIGAQEVAPPQGEHHAGEVVAAIEDARRAIPVLERRPGWTAGDVRIVDVASVIEPDERAAALQALERQADGVEALRDVIDYSSVRNVERPDGGEARLEEILAERGVRAEDVVGVEPAGDTLTVFIWDRATIAGDTEM